MYLDVVSGRIFPRFNVRGRLVGVMGLREESDLRHGDAVGLGPAFRGILVLSMALAVAGRPMFDGASGLGLFHGWGMLDFRTSCS